MEFNLKGFKVKDLPVRYKKLSANKTFVGLSAFKHTNSTLSITYHVYNPRLMSLSQKLREIHKSLYYPEVKCKMLSKKMDRNGQEVKTFNRPFTLGEYLDLPNHYEE
jgi:hypothetical protein